MSTAPPPYGDLAAAWPRPNAAFRPRVWQLLLSAAVFTWLLLDVLLDGPVRRLDHPIASGLLDLGWRDHSVLREVGYLLSQAGGRGTNLAWIVVLCAVVFFRLRTLAPLGKALSATAIMYVCVYPFKEWLSRSYPADPNGDYFHAVGNLGGAFPSGHQANATLLGSVGAWIAIEHLRERWVRVVVGGYALAAPLMSAAAVLLMGYHWLTDVIAGTAAGVLLLALVRWLWSTAPGRRLEELLSFQRA